MVRPARTSVSPPWSWVQKGTCGKRDGSRRRGLCCSAAGCLWPGCGMERLKTISDQKGCWGLLSYRRAAKKGRQAIGTHMVHGKRFCKSTCIFISSLSSRIESMEFVNRGGASYVYSGEKWKTGTKSRSEMPVWTVSQRFSHLQWRRLFKELWGRPTTTADFWSSLWQVPYTSNVCLLEDKVQDRGMYLFAISYGSNAMDQRSGVGWFSGWIKIFVIYSWYFNAKLILKY